MNTQRWQLEQAMTALQMHFTMQYGLDDMSGQDWQLYQPVTQPCCSPMESAFKRFLHLQALVHHQKPGGYTVCDLETVALFVAALRFKAGRPGKLETVLISKDEVPRYLAPHVEWYQKLKPVLAR